ncbi:MAG: hypothetical protein JXQ65_00050 [Candidatus Marinimicrobia bacterium]|nr:hypothetical protein [Candidatus Neomarinimicrobiota bacterium]
MMNRNICALLSLLFLLVVRCTENPFFSDEKRMKKEKISGRVELKDGVDPAGVFIWLKTFDLSTYTDEKGKFSLSLPLPENQDGGTGYEGKFILYFFMANYRTDSLTLEFTHGELLEDQDHIIHTGKLKNTITLEPLISFKTTEFQDCLQEEDYFLLEFDRDSLFQVVDVEVTVHQRTLVLYSLRQDREWPDTGFFRTGMIFLPLDHDSDPVFIESFNAFQSQDAVLAYSTGIWSFELGLRLSDFEEADYEAFPYILIDHPEIPGALWSALGEEKMNFDANYLQYPFKRTPARVRIVDKTD